MYVHRRLKPEAVEHMLRFIVDSAYAHGNIFPVAQGVAEASVCHGGDNGVGIGVAVAGNKYLIHVDFPQKRSIILVRL